MKLTLASPMSMFDKLFKGKDKPEPVQPRETRPEDPQGAAPATGEAPPATDIRSPEECVGIVAGMEKPAIKAQLAKMFRRYNHLASSLDSASRAEAETMLDLIVQMREKYLG